MKGCAGACSFCTAFFFWPGHARATGSNDGDVCGTDGGAVRDAPSDERRPRHRLGGRPARHGYGRDVVGSVRYTDVEAKYRYWKREVAREKGTRPQAASINLGGF